MISRGEVYWANLNPTTNREAGSEQTGIRPVLILSNNQQNRVANTVVVIPLTTSERAGRLPTAIHIKQGLGRLNEGYAICHQIRVLDKTHLKERIGQLPAALVTEVAQKVREILDIP